MTSKADHNLKVYLSEKAKLNAACLAAADCVELTEDDEEEYVSVVVGTDQKNTKEPELIMIDTTQKNGSRKITSDEEEKGDRRQSCLKKGYAQPLNDLYGSDSRVLQEPESENEHHEPPEINEASLKNLLSDNEDNLDKIQVP